MMPFPATDATPLADGHRIAAPSLAPRPRDPPRANSPVAHSTSAAPKRSAAPRRLPRRRHVSAQGSCPHAEGRMTLSSSGLSSCHAPGPRHAVDQLTAYGYAVHARPRPAPLPCELSMINGGSPSLHAWIRPSWRSSGPPRSRLQHLGAMPAVSAPRANRARPSPRRRIVAAAAPRRPRVDRRDPAQSPKCSPSHQLPRRPDVGHGSAAVAGAVTWPARRGGLETCQRPRAAVNKVDSISPPEQHYRGDDTGSGSRCRLSAAEREPWRRAR